MDSTELPQVIRHLLRSSQFLHLGTCFEDIPHVSLMNYTFVDSGEATQVGEEDPVIVLTTYKDTQKYNNIVRNPNVSLLVHDWVTAKNLSEATLGSSNSQAAASGELSPLLKLLKNLNQAEISNMSATLSGKAEILAPGPKQEFFKQLHLKSNSGGNATENTMAKVFIDVDEVVVILVRVDSARLTDYENNVSNWRSLAD